MRKVLIANRGEIAIRVARACRDAGLTSVAVYAESDRDAPHLRLADEAFRLDGQSLGETYLDVAKLLRVARDSGADAVHPGYGFLSENADFAQAVLDAGLVWIGPPPEAIRRLGDKVSARLIAEAAGAPLAPGTTDAVGGAAEVTAFARRHGLPVAIKAVYGGGGRGLKVARTLEEIPDLFDSAVREAVAAFGRGECFVERYLDRPRHVETQCLADRFGNVVVVSTRDCSLQRRHQKLVEEAPAPFLTAEQDRRLREASRRILREVGYVGAGTCEFLLAEDGTPAFLEVNTRLQVEHPVTEEVTGIDLVREMFRIAEGEELGYGDPEPRGHSIEFRINAEDPGRGFLPGPGVVTRWRVPGGPGVRIDSGVEEGSVVSPAWDSMLAKLIVTGSTRRQALERARRALAEFEVAGLPTTLPFHAAVVADPDFAGEAFRVHTRWIESEFGGRLPAYDGGSGEPYPAEERAVYVIEVDGRRVEVSMPVQVGAQVVAATGAGRRAGRRSATRGPGASTGDALVSPMQGTLVKVAVQDGQTVAAGDLVVVLEAMKMEQPITAHKPGMVRGLAAVVGESVATGTRICDIA
ncbi:biotin carboxylase N-terminal domain-containing protein [Nonomuraea sp. NPDC050310]|uniref:acetyl/propionyl/methylcrotonyl-CoA carboxylase subunit alpha n=1 Tax=Nonomuraea sp. NPDC050310 TaxID=3154935 RepID=UPI0033CABD45